MFQEIKTLSFIIHLEFLENSHRHMKVVDAKGEIY
jgi:hypothetical protein